MEGSAGLRKGQGFAIETITHRDGDLGARRADERALVLALEEVYDDAVVPPLVLLPACPRHPRELLIASTHPVRALDVGLLTDSIKVLVEAVEKEGDEFLRIVLLVANERWGKASECALKV